MKVWVVEVCVDDEYGCMSLFGIYSSKEAAHEAAKKEGLQNIDRGEDYNFCTDYYRVKEYDVR